MTIPSPEQLVQMDLEPRALRLKIRDLSSRSLLAMGVAGVLASVLSILSIGMFIGVGLFALFVLGWPSVRHERAGRWPLAARPGRSSAWWCWLSCCSATDRPARPTPVH